MRAAILGMAGVAIGVAVWSLSGIAETKEAKQARSRPPAKAGRVPAAAAAEKTPAAAAEPSAESKPADKKTETAIFAGGCFWCTEFAFEHLVGVLDVESGYCGGTKLTANYDQVHLGTTGHAEAVRITYDPQQVSYNKLLDVFFDSHDPTQLNRQGEDEGKQYRSAIFYANDEQHQEAKAKIADLELQRVFKRKIMTKLEPLKEFYPAEEYHQNFAEKHPALPYIQGHAVPKAIHVRTKHPELVPK